MGDEGIGQSYKVEIVPPRGNPWAWVGSLPIVLAFVVFGYFGTRALQGTSQLALEGTLAAALAVMLGVWLRVMLRRPRLRATIDEEGMTLPSVRHWFVRREVRFRWDEVERVKLAPSVWLRYRAGLSINLDRPQPFWSLRFSEPSHVLLPPTMWHRPEVRKAILQHVAPERVDAHLRDFSVKKELRRADRWTGAVLLGLSATMILIIAMITLGLRRAGTIFDSMFPALLHEQGLITKWQLVKYYVWRDAGMWTYTVCLWLLVSATVMVVLLRLARDRTLKASLLLGVAAVCGIWPAAAWWVAIRRAYPPIETGFLGAGAGVFACLGAFLLAGVRHTRWRHLALCSLVVVVGFWTGWFGYGGIRTKEVTEGFFGVWSRAWTPRGDGFFIEDWERDGREHEKRRPKTTLRWYSTDLAPGRSFGFERWVGVVAVGNEGALCLQSGDEGRFLLFLPRGQGPIRRPLGAAYGSYTHVHLSPDGLRAVVSATPLDVPEEKQVGSRLWFVIDMRTGEARRVFPPVSDKDIVHMGIRDTGRLVWLTGPVRPHTQSGLGLYRLCNEGKPEGKDEPVRIFFWDPSGSEAPRRAFEQKPACFGFRVAERFERVFIERIGQETWQYAELVVSDVGVTEIASTRERFEYGDRFVSADGRFRVSSRSERISIEDTRTGKRRHLRDLGYVFMREGPWDPKGHKLLYLGTRLPIIPTRRDPGGGLDFGPGITTVRFVDLDEAW